MIVSTISEKVDKSDVESISSETIKDESGLSLSQFNTIRKKVKASISKLRDFSFITFEHNKQLPTNINI